MSCYHPLHAVRLHNTSDKPIIVGARRDVKDNVIPDAILSGRSPMSYDHLYLPCGQCIGCRMDYARRWADRMMLELESHSTAYFITLTYDDDHVSVSHYATSFWHIAPDGRKRLYPSIRDDLVADDWTVEPVMDGTSLTLCPPHVRDWLKRLRRQQEYHHNGNKIRYYLVGEYGSTTARPHYHAIIYGLQLDDLEPFGRSAAGNYPYYRSATLERTWTYGYVGVANVTWETCAYTARYMLKKHKGATADVYTKYALQPEYSVMSRCPGIGANYYVDHRDEIYANDEIIISTPRGGRVIRPPQYYDKMYDLEYPSRMADIKSARRIATELQLAAEMEQYSGTLDELMRSKEIAMQARGRKLLRPLD